MTPEQLARLLCLVLLTVLAAWVVWLGVEAVFELVQTAWLWLRTWNLREPLAVIVRVA